MGQAWEKLECKRLNEIIVYKVKTALSDQKTIDFTFYDVYARFLNPILCC
jgi:hypothetical protein